MGKKRRVGCKKENWSLVTHCNRCHRFPISYVPFSRKSTISARSRWHGFSSLSIALISRLYLHLIPQNRTPQCRNHPRFFRNSMFQPTFRSLPPLPVRWQHFQGSAHLSILLKAGHSIKYLGPNGNTFSRLATAAG